MSETREPARDQPTAGHDDPDLADRLRAVERAITDADVTPADLSEPAAIEERLDRLEDRVDELEGRLAETEAGVEAVRGYVGSVRAVNRDVERRADAALAAADADDDGSSVDPGDVDLPGEEGRRGGAGRSGEEESVRERLEQLL